MGTNSAHSLFFPQSEREWESLALAFDNIMHGCQARLFSAALLLVLTPLLFLLSLLLCLLYLARPAHAVFS